MKIINQTADEMVLKDDQSFLERMGAGINIGGIQL
jgi:hypothetical protein